MSAALFRLFTTAQLKDYGRAAAAFLATVLAPLGGLPRPLSLRTNPFEEPEREVTPAEAESILADAETLDVDAFELCLREPGALFPFPFLFRVCGAIPTDIYKYSEWGSSRLPYPASSPHGYRIDCALSEGLWRTASLGGEEALWSAFQDLFIRSGAVYGYGKPANPLEIFSGYSKLEQERNAPDRAYRGMWSDTLRQTTSGAFAGNWFGRELSARLAERAPLGAGWIVKDIGKEIGLSIRALEGLAVGEHALEDLAVWMADLLPPEEERVALPEMIRESIVLQPADLLRLGGAAFVREALTPWRVTELKSGRAILTTEYRFRSGHLVPGACLWPLRPAKLELWEIDIPGENLGRAVRPIPLKEPARAQIRLRFSQEELASKEGIPVYVMVKGPAKGTRSALLALRNEAAKAGGRFEVTAETSQLTEGRIWLTEASLDTSIELVESVRAAVGSRHSFLLALGSMSEDEIDIRLRMTGPNRLYMKL